MIDAVIVVVPVHDEEALLPACLAAIDTALSAVPRRVRRTAVTVLDACTDRSAAIAADWAGGADARCVLEVAHRNVGHARRDGIAAGLAAVAAGLDPARTWIATSDADSVVPEHWLTAQLALADQGIEAIAGTVRVSDWGDYSSELATRFVRFYDDTSTHVHGANLGLRADAYAAVGGFAPLATGEDHALWDALGAGEHRRISSRGIAVVTSARRRGRAPAGFSDFLSTMERAA